MHKPNHKTLGMKVAELLPSQHPDRERAKEQERGLQEFIDFFVPQSGTDIALSFAPFGLIAKKASKLGKPIVKELSNKVQFLQDIKYRRDFNKRVASGEETQKMLSEMDEAKTFVNDWMDAQRTPSAEYLKKNMVYDKPVMKQAINSTDESLQVVEETLGADGPFGRYSYGSIKPFDDVDWTKNPPTGFKLKNYIKDPSELQAVREELAKIASEKKEALDFIGFPKPSRKIILNKSFMQNSKYALKVEREYGIPFEVYRKALLIHEYTHAITRGDMGLPKEFKKFIRMARRASKKELGARVEPGAMHYSGFREKYVPSTSEYISYLESPTEVFARIMTMRYLLKETPEAITKMSRRIQPSEVKNIEPYNQLLRIFSPKQIENLYNNLPAMLPVGLYSASQLDEIAEKIDEQN
tara:strand:+ start:148 stop:1383 length:1236 start_codon:yes stop_codon:yes gene_type:complete